MVERSLENPEEYGDLFPYYSFINDQGKRTKEKKRIEKRTGQFYWEQKIGMVLFLIFIISAGLLMMLVDWLA